MFKLSSRMQLIFDQLLPGEPVWDFCCDHGYLGLNAYESGLFPAVHFVDQVCHIIEQLESRFTREIRDEESHTEVFFYPQAAENLKISVQGSVVIAGVGAYTMLKILRNLHESDVLKAQRLILCPQGDAEKIVHGLLEFPVFDYEFCNEDCKIEERGRTRKLLILNRKRIFRV